MRRAGAAIPRRRLRRAFVAAAATAVLSTGPAPLGATECSDALDNDADGRTDLDDAGCLMDPARDDETGEFVATSTADEVDASPGDGLCESSPSSECTVRAAIMETNALGGAQGVQLPAGTFELTIGPVDFSSPSAADGDLNVSGDLVLIGEGPDQTGIGGDLAHLSFRVLDVLPATQVTISGVTVRRGYAKYALDNDDFNGGGIRSAGTLTLIDSSVSRNRARDSGGGIHSTGDLTLIDSRVAYNFAPYVGGGIYAEAGSLTLVDSSVSDNAIGRYFFGVAIASWVPATLTRTTVSGNYSTVPYGTAGVFPVTNFDATMTLTNSTVSGNGHGGIANSGVLTLINTTVAGNTTPGYTLAGVNTGSGAQTVSTNSIIAENGSRNCTGPFQSDGHNLSDDTTCFPGTGTDIVAPAQLGPLADHGGPTETHLPMTGSPAIDAGDDAACPETDQRGVPRPQDGDDPPDGMAHCDIGAVELAPEPGASLLLAAGAALLLALRVRAAHRAA